VGDYASVDQLAQYAGAGANADDFALGAALAAACGWVDSYCGRSFEYAERETRSFAASSASTVVIPDAAVIWSVTVAGTEWPTSAWEAVPSRPSTFDTLWPAGKIVAVDRCWPSGRDAVAVDADWGWDVTPAAVRMATLMMALRLYKRSVAWEGVAGGGEFGAIRLANIDPDVAILLRPFKRIGIA
jgi:hypothetical protein